MLCVEIAAAFAGSGWYRAVITIPRGPIVMIDSGSVGAVIGVDRSKFPNTMNSSLMTPLARIDFGFGNLNQWMFGAPVPSASMRMVMIPIYALFLAVALPTLLVWRFVPKFPRGHCRRCGYNLTGLREARCPECGQPFEAKGDAS